MSTQLAEPLAAKKKFIDSLTYYKKYLGENQESSSEVQVDECRIIRPTLAIDRGRAISRVRKIKPTEHKRTIVAVEEHAIQTELEAEPLPTLQANESKAPHPTFTLKRGRAISRVRKIKPTEHKRTIVAVEEHAIQTELEAEPLPTLQANESKAPHPTFTLKRGRAISRVRTINPKIRKRKRTLVFTVQETVAEEEITPEKFVNSDVNKLPEDEFYTILGFLESEKRKLDRITFAEKQS